MRPNLKQNTLLTRTGFIFYRMTPLLAFSRDPVTDSHGCYAPMDVRGHQMSKDKKKRPNVRCMWSVT